MSINVSYFFNSDHSLAELSRQINSVLGTRLEPYEGDPSDLFCRFMSLEIGLSEHSLENDRDADFENYRYELDTRTPIGDADLRDLQVAWMAMVPTILQRRAGITAGILIYDAQRLLCRYMLNDGYFFDALAGRKISFPEHLQDIFSRAA